jgi:hypothetical protein
MCVYVCELVLKIILVYVLYIHNITVDKISSYANDFNFILTSESGRWREQYVGFPRKGYRPTHMPRYTHCV